MADPRVPLAPSREWPVPPEGDGSGNTRPDNGDGAGRGGQTPAAGGQRFSRKVVIRRRDVAADDDDGPGGNNTAGGSDNVR